MTRLFLSLSLLAALACTVEEVPYCEARPEDPVCFDAGTDGAVPDAMTDAPLVDAPVVDAPTDSTADTGLDAGMDAGPCGMACGGATPFCREADGVCVACLADANCTSPGAPTCDATGACVAGCEAHADCARFSGDALTRCASGGPLVGQCVSCDAHADCTAPGAAQCDETSKSCVPCSMHEHCAGTGQNVCVGGTCRQCTEATAATHCGANACDPVANVCTGTGRGTLDTCRPCLSDTECVTGHRCIPLTFSGTARGHYCMPTPPAGGCLASPRPFTVPLTGRVSRSGVASTTYCGINEALTTCEAVRDAMNGIGGGCDPAADPCAEGGRCALVGDPIGGSNRCTYACDDFNQCPNSATLGTCNGTAPNRYCGRL
ncbi:MAG: hypothetical protein KF901_32920 [Myxococcales bacterium]|nr:hypothetical protein [Myxococcales bacterium]